MTGSSKAEKCTGIWQVHAVKYADRNARARRDSFLFDDNHDAPHAMDYFMWLLRDGSRTILVDTGYDQSEATARGRPIRLDPREALAPFELTPEDISEVIVTHLHYDHAGGLALFPNAHLHMQAAEMAFATGPCMCHDVLREPFTAGHICEAIMRLYGGKLTFHTGDNQLAEGLSLHCVGGHSRGLQCVRVRTQAGWMVLASDAAHYYENVLARKPFPIVVDIEDMMLGFERLIDLASRPELIIPGHDPLVRQVYPQDLASHIRRLDVGPMADALAKISLEFGK